MLSSLLLSLDRCSTRSHTPTPAQETILVSLKTGFECLFFLWVDSTVCPSLWCLVARLIPQKGRKISDHSYLEGKLQQAACKSVCETVHRKMVWLPASLWFLQDEVARALWTQVPICSCSVAHLVFTPALEEPGVPLAPFVLSLGS